MDTLLKSKGFALNEYPEGKYYEYTDKNADDNTLNIARLFGYSGDGADMVILQCDENFENCVLYVDLNLWHLSSDEFISAIRKM